MHYKQIIALVMTGVMALFIIQNMAMVEIQFLLWSFALPRALLLLIVLATGGLIGWLWHSWLVYGHKNG